MHKHLINNNEESQTIIENLSSKISEIGDTIDSGIVDLEKGIDNKASWVAKKLDETVSNIGLETSLFENLVDISESVGATVAVGTTSILSGIAKVDELIADGIVWVEGKKVEGVSWLVGEVAGLFSEDTKNSIMKWREDVKKSVKSEIERDRVGELNEWFYENTKIGQSINEKSYLKYDSDVAKALQKQIEENKESNDTDNENNE